MQPTPTPFAYETVEYITLNSEEWRIWSFTDDAINVWNYNPTLGVVIQTAIIVILIIAFVVLITRLIQEMMSEE